MWLLLTMRLCALIRTLNYLLSSSLSWCQNQEITNGITGSFKPLVSFHASLPGIRYTSFKRLFKSKQMESHHKTEAIFANILADIELGKNLELHLLDLSGSLEALVPKINEGHRSRTDVSTFENLALILMGLTNRLRFQITVSDGIELPLIMPQTITNLRQIMLDTPQYENMDYHRAAITYDIDNLNRIIDHDQTDKEAKDISMRLRDTYQELLLKIKQPD
jgi:hypothetical protein